MKRILALLIASSFSMAATPASAKPLRVFIMAGQSNMEGHANVETFKFQL
jgi:alpha-galactosidase